jgi:hypothetical protein
MAAALLLALTYWIDRLLIAQRGAAGNLGFAVLFTLLCLGYTALVLWPRQTARLHPLEKEHEHGEK